MLVCHFFLSPVQKVPVKSKKDRKPHMGSAWALVVVVASSCHLPCGAGITPSIGCKGGSPARGWVPSQITPQAIPPAKQGTVGTGDKFWAAPHHLQSLPRSWGPLWEPPCLVSGVEGSAAPEPVPTSPPSSCPLPHFELMTASVFSVKQVAHSPLPHHCKSLPSRFRPVLPFIVEGCQWPHAGRALLPAC